MTELIKRDDALAAIDTFNRDFEQSWKVQFSADIKALPAIDPADIREAALQARIEELEKDQKQGGEDYCALMEKHDALHVKLTKAVALARKECPYDYDTKRYDAWWKDRRAALAELGEDK